MSIELAKKTILDLVERYQANQMTLGEFDEAFTGVLAQLKEKE